VLRCVSVIISSLKVSDGGTINLLSRSFGEYNINEHGFHKRSGGPDESDEGEKAYRCASEDMHIFGPIGNGASSVVQRAIFIPVHRILALKKINIFEKVHIFIPYGLNCSLQQHCRITLLFFITLYWTEYLLKIVRT
jgi:hypothetical protein